MITLLLADDEPLIRQGSHTWLERVGDIRVIGEASNGAEAIALAQELHPDVVHRSDCNGKEQAHFARS